MNISQLSSNSFATTFMPPTESFTMQFFGMDENGHNFSHISDIFFDVSSVYLSLSKLKDKKRYCIESIDASIFSIFISRTLFLCFEHVNYFVMLYLSSTNPISVVNLF